MKKLFLLFLCMLAAYCIAQNKVAVYVTTSEQVDNSIQKIIGSEMTAAIVKTKDYSAVERTNEFLAKISEEQTFQRTGAVDDQQISELGKLFGVNLVCVIDLTSFKNSYYIQARLIDVENATVTTTARETSTLEDMATIVSTAEHLATAMFAKDEAKEIYPREYSSCLSQPKITQLMDIKVSIKYTEVHCIVDMQSVSWISISPTTYIIDNDSGVKYKLLNTNGISVSPDKTKSINDQISQEFTLFFEPIPEGTRNIDIIEYTSKTNKKGWEWKNVRLIPYGEKNLYRFQYETITKKSKSQKPTYKFSTILSHPDYFNVEKIIVTQEATVVYCHFRNINEISHVSIGKDMYIIDEDTKVKYKILNVQGINVDPQKTTVYQSQRRDFTISFAPIPLSTKHISIVHPDNRSRIEKISGRGNKFYFNCSTMTLYPYSKEG